MTEQPNQTEKTYKQPPAKRAYFRDRRRKMLLENKKCCVCGNQATIRVLLTQDVYCLKDYVSYLKNGGPNQNIEKVNNTNMENKTNEQTT